MTGGAPRIEGTIFVIARNEAIHAAVVRSDGLPRLSASQ
jgi:hypothetical protein